LCTAIVSLGIVWIVFEANLCVDDDFSVVFVFQVDEGTIAVKFGNNLRFGGLAVDAFGVLFICELEVVHIVRIFLKGLAALLTAVFSVDVSVFFVLEVFEGD
jgi:hypothetical protein